jgi:PAS domain S-box-containing protein
MKKKNNRPGDAAELRKQAEKIARERAAQSPENIEALSPEETRQLLHELRVQQIELEMQNEELRRTQKKLDAARARYFDLYDLAPVGYVTLSEKGLFLEANLTAATLLGVARGALVKQLLTRFIVKEDRDIYYLHSKQLFETGEPQTCELRMVKKDTAPFWLRIDTTAAQDADGTPVCRAVLRDITERKQAEKALRVSHDLLAIANRHTQIIPLLKEYMGALRNFSDCSAIGIRLLDEEGNIPYQAYEGFSQGFYESESPLSIRSDQCMCINVIKGETDQNFPFYTEGGSFYMNNTSRFLATVSEEEKGKTRNVCNQAGYESVALIPILTGQRILGLIHMADTQENKVPLKKVEVLENITTQLGTAIRRIETEEKLVETNQMLNNIAQGITDEIFIVSLDRKILWANEAILRTSGYKMGEVVGNYCYKVTHKEANPCQFPDHVCPIEEVRQKGRPITLTHTHFDAEGNRFVVDVSAYPVRDKNGEVVQFVHISKDITQRKQTEERLRETKNYLENLLDYANVPIIVWDPTFKITRFNHAFERLTEFTADEVSGENLAMLFPKDSKDESLSQIRSTLKGERWESVEIPILRKDGDIRTVLWNSANIFAEDGTILIATIAQGYDITERKQAEKQLKQTLESLRKAVGTTIQVVVSAVETRDPYTAGHQFRSADLARAIATEMGLPKDKIEGIRIAGSIHDIGKLSIPTEILSKPSKLSEIEFSLIKEHARKGFEILKDVESPWPLAEIVYQHHERMDGSGYPRKLKGDDILIEARILSVADVVEAMASHRPYRPALGLNAALEEIKNNKGTLYDADAVGACLRLFREKGFQLEGA